MFWRGVVFSFWMDSHWSSHLAVCVFSKFKIIDLHLKSFVQPPKCCLLWSMMFCLCVFCKVVQKQLVDLSISWQKINGQPFFYAKMAGLCWFFSNVRICCFYQFYIVNIIFIGKLWCLMMIFNYFLTFYQLND